MGRLAPIRRGNTRQRLCPTGRQEGQRARRMGPPHPGAAQRPVACSR